MDKRQAFLKAADLIERNPSRYDFMSNRDPGVFGTGCMISWAGHFAGVVSDDPTHYVSAAARALVGPAGIIRAVFRLYRLGKMANFTGAVSQPHIAVRLLRAYADKYHPAPASKFPALDPAFVAFKDSLNEQSSTPRVLDRV